MLKRPSIQNEGILRIGDRTQLRSDIHRCRLAVQAGAQLVIGEDCLINGAMIDLALWIAEQDGGSDGRLSDASEAMTIMIESLTT